MAWVWPRDLPSFPAPHETAPLFQRVTLGRTAPSGVLPDPGCLKESLLATHLSRAKQSMVRLVETGNKSI